MECPFLCSILVCLISLHTSVFKAVLRYRGYVYLCHLTCSLRYSRWLIPSSRHNPLQSVRPCISSDKTSFFANGHAQLHHLYCVIQSEMLNDYHSPAHLFCSCSLFSFSSTSASETVSVATECITFMVASS